MFLLSGNSFELWGSLCAFSLLRMAAAFNSCVEQTAWFAFDEQNNDE